jgi:type II restriction/modification system DNA methylase subunit YeeA
MKGGGDFGCVDIPWFNGGLFDDDDALPLDRDTASQILEAARLDWSQIEPSIFGTLFERGLDPSKRSQIGAHYTDPESIYRIIYPVIKEPLEAEWNKTKKDIEGLLAVSPSKRKNPLKEAEKKYEGFLQRLCSFRVLDAACGSGNFLYLALVELKNLEHRVRLEGEAYGFHRSFCEIGPHNVIGIEINDYAAELARVTIWIGEIQWMIRNGFGAPSNPILKRLENIKNGDALLNPDGTEAEWPVADCIIGNPPLLTAQAAVQGWWPPTRSARSATELCWSAFARVGASAAPGATSLGSTRVRPYVSHWCVSMTVERAVRQCG